jgi:hypothetical protein
MALRDVPRVRLRADAEANRGDEDDGERRDEAAERQREGSEECAGRHSADA